MNDIFIIYYCQCFLNVHIVIIIIRINIIILLLPSPPSIIIRINLKVFQSLYLMKSYSYQRIPVICDQLECYAFKHPTKKDMFHYSINLFFIVLKRFQVQQPMCILKYILSSNILRDMMYILKPASSIIITLPFVILFH